jgi:hypothetical protein
MRRFLILASLLASSCLAQTCNTGQILLKNDNLPAVPSGPTPVSIIQGLCEGEACAAVFNTTGLGAVKVDAASVAYINAGNASGIQAAADLEFFDGVTFSGATANLGPSLFRWSTVTGSSIGLLSSGINIGPDLTSYNIIATSGKLVVAWWMDFNPQGGTCAAGYTTNFATDYGGGGGFSCNPTITPQHKNLLYIAGQGWSDASLATVQGFPLCPIYYAGNWIIRVCVEQPPVLTIFGPPTPPAGSYLTLQYQSVNNPGAAYICGLSLGTTPGIPWPPYGTVPLNDDFALEYMLPDIFEQPGAAQNWAINFTGSLNASGLAYGTFQVPPVSGISGITIYFAFVLQNAGRISNAASITVL